MKTKDKSSNWQSGILAALMLMPLGGFGSGFQLVSALDNASYAPAGGNGDSYLPIISRDGRFVLFASTANNLVLTNNNGPVPSQPLHPLNVFLRDRLNATTTLVSVNPAGNGCNGDSIPAGISANGQFALFESAASDLAPGATNNNYNVYVRDIVNGWTILASVSTNGAGGNGSSRNSMITPDGRYVAFVSEANNLVPKDTNGIPDVFVRDLQANTTTLVSVGAVSAGLTTLLNGSESPMITSDGRFVAFDSTATNLVAGVRSAGEVYVRDLVGGTTVWASTNALGIFYSVCGNSNAVSCQPDISTNGQFVAFEVCTNNPVSPNSEGVVLRYNLQTGVTDIVCTNANAPLSSPLEIVNNLDLSPDGRFMAYAANGAGNSGNTVVFLWDAQTGTNILVSADQTTGLPATGNCGMPVVNATGQFVAFLCNATNLTTNTLSSAGGYDLYLRDTQAGLTTLVDADTNGIGIGVAQQTVPALSDDGSLVFFDRVDGSLIASDNNHDWDVFARNVTTGTTELISVHDPALPSQTPNGFSVLYSTCVSTNGRYVAFASDADNLVANDTNGFRDVFVYDTVLGTNILVSVATNGFTGTNLSSEPSISADGRYVAFASDAPLLVPKDGNNARDVFVRDLQAGTTELVSSNVIGGASASANADSYAPIISSNGRYVLFYSKANYVAAGLTGNGIVNAILRDRQLGTNYAVPTTPTEPGVTTASMTPDGHYVAFVSYGGDMFIWDSQATAWIYTNASSTNISFSADGHWLANAGLTLKAYDLSARTNYLIASSGSVLPSQAFSADDRFLVFSMRLPAPLFVKGTNEVYLHDFQNGSNILVSTSFNSTNAANGSCDSAVISPDGRFIAYRSAASNLVPNDTNGVPDLFLYDRSNNATMLVTVNQTGSSSANNRSLLPVFSADSSTLVFESYASDLPGPGYNEFSALYAFNLASFPVVVASGGSGLSDSNLFSAQLIPPGQSQYPQLNWPLVSGKTYQVQYKNDLNDANWQNVNGSIIFLGGTAQINDLSPSPNKRFYRIVLNN